MHIRLRPFLQIPAYSRILDNNERSTVYPLIPVMNITFNQLSIVLILAGFVLPGAPPPLSAELYKWVDADGVTHYSQRPPPGHTAVETITIRTEPASEAALQNMQEQARMADKLREARLHEAELKRLAEEERAIREENCRRSRAKLTSYQIPNALIAQPDGSRIRVDEETRQRELASAREMIEKYCN